MTEDGPPASPGPLALPPKAIRAFVALPLPDSLRAGVAKTIAAVG